MVLPFNKIITFINPVKSQERLKGTQLQFLGLLLLLVFKGINIPELENNFHIFNLLRELGIPTG